MSILALFATLISSESFSQTIPLFVKENVGTLPQGRFMISYLSLNASVDSIYGKNGESQTLSSALNQSITFQKIAEQDSVRTNQLKGLFEANGVALQDSAGSLHGSIHGVVDGKVPVIGYGITDTLGVYASIPVLNFQIHSDYQFNQSPESQRFLTQLRSTDQASVADEFEVAYQNSLETKLHQSDYYWDPRLNRNYLGDIQLQLIQILPKPNASLYHDLIQPILVLPTANDHNTHDLYGLRAGDRRWGVGIRYAGELHFDRFKFNGSVQTLHLFSKTDARRIAKSADDEVKEFYDPNVSLSGGQKFESQIQAHYQIKKWISSSLGLHYQKKLQEQWNGSLYSIDQYEISSEGTRYDLFSSFWGVELNSIPSFLAGEFLIPGIVDLGVGIPIMGRNAIAEPVIQLQGSIFF